MAAPFYLARCLSLAPPLSVPPFPSFSFPICVPVRLARRLVISSRRASRLVRFVASCRSSCRLTCSSRRLVIRRPACRLVSRRSVLLFACSHSVCRGGFALCSHAVSFSPWRFVHRLVGSSRSFPSSRSVSLVGVSCPLSCLVSVFAPFRLARSLFLFAYSVPVHVLCRGVRLCVMAMGQRLLALLISSVPHGSY